MRAMPSPIWRTVPTSARSVSTSYCSILALRIDVISSGLSFKALSAPHEFVSQSFQSPAHARVDAERSRLQDDSAHEVGVDLLRRLDLAPRRILELLRYLLELAGAPFLRDQLEEVREQRLLVAGEVVEDRGLRARLELRVAQ